jgi:flagellar P-ring protein precursor FlgI
MKTTRTHRSFRLLIGLVLLLIAQVAVFAETPQRMARVKDIASIEGIRENQLVGYGIVVGLNGTGDSQQTGFPVQTLASTLLRMGVSVPASSIRVQNMAAVFVSASLPPFARSGTRVDLTVSSAGDAHSLEGGLLLMTPLYGTDGKIYAEAQGPLVLGGYSVTANGSSKSVNHPTTARVPLGGSIERGIPLDIAGRTSFNIMLQDEDFRSARSVADAINKELGRTAAHASNSRSIELQVKPGEDVPELLSRVEGVEVSLSPRAKVVVNERTGTVVIGGNVVLQPASILHGGLAVNIVSEFQVSQPNGFSNGTTQVVQQTRIDATARDVISILQAMKSAGAVEAEIEVL